jgi:DNA-directed RNA polymerase subunit F
MWKESSPVEIPKANAPQIATVKPVTEDELRGILDRLETARDVFRENRELRSVLSRRDAETKELRSRNSELEEIMRKFAPMLLNVATTMGLAAKTESQNSRNEL